MWQYPKISQDGEHFPLKRNWKAFTGKAICFLVHWNKKSRKLPTPPFLTYACSSKRQSKTSYFTFFCTKDENKNKRAFSNFFSFFLVFILEQQAQLFQNHFDYKDQSFINLIKKLLTESIKSLSLPWVQVRPSHFIPEQSFMFSSCPNLNII